MKLENEFYDRKRCLICNGTLGSGGAERVVLTLAKELLNYGYETELLIYYDEIFYDIEDGISVHSVTSETRSNNKFVNAKWVREYCRGKFDIIISFIASINIFILGSTLGLKIPIVVADRNDPRRVPFHNVMRGIRNIAYEFADGVVLQTERNKSYFSNRIQRKSIVIPNPVNTGDYQGRALEYKKDRRIVSVGRLLPQKNQKMLIKAFSKVHRSYPDYELVIYGEGPERNKLEGTIKELHLEKAVTLAGRNKNIFEALLTAEMFVLSSDFEGMPNALMEAMSVGLPVISTRVSGADEIIVNGKNGLLIDCGDEDGLSNAMMTYISNPSIAKSCAICGIDINRTHSIRTAMDKWLNFIEIYIGKTGA